jgi:hypothetical protein
MRKWSGERHHYSFGITLLYYGKWGAILCENKWLHTLRWELRMGLILWHKGAPTATKA